jgi:hypothetical protein
MSCRVLRVGIVAGILLTAYALAPAAETPIPAASPSPAAAPSVAPLADKLLTGACQALASSKAFTFHAEILFDELLPQAVKVQFAGALDFALQRPDELMVDYRSDLGSKTLWYQGTTLTILDPSHAAYSILSVPGSIDGMLEQVATSQGLTIPLSDLAFSDPCQNLRKEIIFGGYIGINDVNGVDGDHLAFSSSREDLQLWLARSGKPIPLKLVITYRTEPGSPQYIATFSDWKFPEEIPSSRFRAALPKDAQRIEFLKVKESQP